MKKKFLMSTFALLSSFALASCTCSITPVPGPTGPAGQDGQDGQDGTNGLDGVDGATWLFGEGEPSADSGKVGDLYLNTTNYDIYVKTESGWKVIGNVKGQDGLPGKDGATGSAGQDGEDGKDGQDGATWLYGEGAPADDLGKEGDLYLNTATYDIYNKTASGWKAIGNIKGQEGLPGQDGATGPAGQNGADGATWLFGNGAPADDLGKTGDLYLDTASYDIYAKTDSGWTVIGNIKGEEGQNGSDGDKGETGDKGDTGETAWSNTILPSQGGYVTADKGSAIADGKETVTFTAVDTDADDEKTPYSLTLTNNGVSETHVLDAKMQYTAIMKEGGFVVSLNFADEIKNADSLDDLFTNPNENLDSGENDFVLSEGTFDLAPTNETLDYSKSEKVVISGKVDENGNPETTLNLGKKINFNGAQNAGSIELRNLNIEMSQEVNNSRLFEFNFGTNVSLENVNVNVNKKITEGQKAVMFFNTPNADISIKDISIDNSADPTYYDALQIWTAHSFTGENLQIKDVDNPFTIHLFDAGDTFNFVNCDFNTFSPIMFANENAYNKKTKEEFDSYKEKLESNRPQVNLTNCNIISTYPYFAYYYLPHNVAAAVNDKYAYQIDCSWLDINFNNTKFNGSLFDEERFDKGTGKVNKYTGSEFNFFEFIDLSVYPSIYKYGLLPNITFNE